MPWISDTEYKYTKGIIKAIADSYMTIYECLTMPWNVEILNLYQIVEYKADFDIALSGIGKQKWAGLSGMELRDYRYFGKLQKVVIAGILGISDYELQSQGFYQIPQLRGRAYSRMMEYLNNSFVRAKCQS